RALCTEGFAGTKSGLGLIDTHYRLLIVLSGNGHEKRPQIRDEEGCPGSRRRRLRPDTLVVVGILLVDGVDEALPGGEINALGRRVVEQVVRIPRDRQLRDLLAGLRV